MSLQGTVIHGVVVLDAGGQLPDGTRVEVTAKQGEEMSSSPTVEASRLRISWMTEVGLSVEEIRQSFDEDPPLDPEKERAELHAAQTLKKTTPSRETLESWAAKASQRR